MFGNNTLLTNGSRAGQFATNGFDALADLDSNADGLVNSSDSQFANLRLRRDLNQDGESQTGDPSTGSGRELFTLAELGIIGINVYSEAARSTTLANGNQLADTGSFIKADGSTGTGTVAVKLGDVNLVDDTLIDAFLMSWIPLQSLACLICKAAARCAIYVKRPPNHPSYKTC